MNYVSLRKQLINLLAIVVASMAIAICTTAVLFVLFVPTYLSSPVSLTDHSFNWIAVPLAHYLNVTGFVMTCCVMTALVYLLGISMHMFPPALRVIRVRN